MIRILASFFPRLATATAVAQQMPTPPSIHAAKAVTQTTPVVFATVADRAIE